MSDNEKIDLTEDELTNKLFEELHSCDGDVLAAVAGFTFGGECYAIDDHYEFFPNGDYTGAFGPLTAPVVEEVDNTIPPGIVQKTSYSFRVPFYTNERVFSHYVYPASSVSPTESGYLDISFDSPEEAYSFLDEYDLREEAIEEQWILIKSVDTVVHYVQPKELE